MPGDLIDEVLDADHLRRAWEQIRANKGGPGIDQVTLARWARNWEENIERLRRQVRTNTYVPSPVKRFLVSKKGGGRREMSRLTISDKVLQRAVLDTIDPFFDTMFLSCSHGYRAHHSTATAIEQVLAYRDQGLRWLVDADIEACFDSLDHEILLALVRQVLDDWFILNLMNLWLKIGRKHRHKAIGVPVGAVISPLWANIYLHQMDRSLCLGKFTLVRYADDFVVFTASEPEANQALEAIRRTLEPLKLKLSEHKTRIASFDQGFRFLGVEFHRDTYSYLCQQTRIKVKGKKIRLLYQQPPDLFY